MRQNSRRQNPHRTFGSTQTGCPLRGRLRPWTARRGRPVLQSPPPGHRIRTNQTTRCQRHPRVHRQDGVWRQHPLAASVWFHEWPGWRFLRISTADCESTRPPVVVGTSGNDRDWSCGQPPMSVHPATHLQHSQKAQRLLRRWDQDERSAAPQQWHLVFPGTHQIPHQIAPTPAANGPTTAGGCGSSWPSPALLLVRVGRPSRHPSNDSFREEAGVLCHLQSARSHCHTPYLKCLLHGQRCVAPRY